MDRDGLAQKLIVEFIGPFALCFAGPTAIIASGGDLVAVALAHGLAIGLMIMAAGHISGGHFNPAVTVAMMATRRIDGATGGAYIVAQLLGGTAGALLVRAASSGEAIDLTVPAVAPTFGNGEALLLEAILTFFLVFAVFGSAVDPRSPKSITGLVIGLVIVMDICAGGNLSGAAMNPARWFSTAVVGGEFADFWIWIVGPVAGAVVAGLIYNDVLLKGVPTPADGVPAEVQEVQAVTPSVPSGASEARRRSTRR